MSNSPNETIADPRRRALRSQQVRTWTALALPLLVALAFAGCGEGTGTATPQARVHVTATADPKHRVPTPKEGAEDTAYALDETPAFLANLKDINKDKIIARYAYAAANRELLAQIPCYCGCAIYEHEHGSLATCYIRNVTEGKIVYTDHSVTCSICTGEVDDMMKAAGTPIKALRDQIHAKYSYTGIWTDTPPIP